MFKRLWGTFLTLRHKPAQCQAFRLPVAKVVSTWLTVTPKTDCGVAITHIEPLSRMVLPALSHQIGAQNDCTIVEVAATVRWPLLRRTFLRSAWFISACKVERLSRRNTQLETLHDARRRSDGTDLVVRGSHGKPLRLRAHSGPGGFSLGCGWVTTPTARGCSSRRAAPAVVRYA